MSGAEEPRGRLPRLTRRRAIALGIGAAVAVAARFEYASLDGRFDHRRALAPSAPERYAASAAALDAAGDSARGVLHVGHSTHVVALGKSRLLTDPWFFDPAFGALSHETAPAVAPEALGRLDAILVTHDHADHADLRAMDRMDKRAVVLVATSDLAARVRALGFSEVSVLAPWEERRVNEVSVTAVPALHDVYEIGFVLRAAGTSVYFAGDTRLHPDLPAIAERLAPDVAILPVDGTRVSGSALAVMTPEDAVEAARTLRCKVTIPSHAEAFFSDPLAKYALASMVERARFRFLEAMARDLPGVLARLPSAGDTIAI